ncbi:MAG TPA: YihY/virulence factor BrkB family protein [Blastocatellia bacterium]|nr:YihY/virulence factor BrkB family protein [Blastocatellia bacterium]HMY70514.1 YihY/virulence factor BrkB family protein [Blastocatellia bacterium]HMZ20756.1 YihY/virulence factor BrkB family protein [Blastocatellia bacterium]HNG30553.1 YihY/virulence factor BrkB family protein [Blastocatellia bacterium]
MRRQGDKETMMQEDENSFVSSSPSLPVPLSPSLPFTLRRLWDKLFEDEVFGRAAQLAYYWLFSLFPLLIFMTALLAFLPIPHSLDYWFGALNHVLPNDAFALINQTFRQVISRRRHGLLSFSILVAVWAASSGMESIIGSLNKAYGAKVSRAYWREKLLAIELTLGLAVFVLTALTLIFFGESVGLRISEYFGLGAAFRTTFNILQWPVGSILILIAVDLIYYFAPNIKQRWHWFTPGAVFAVVGWLLISFGFRYYVSRFGNYNATYGALGGVMVLMLWFYLTGVVILTGGEINSLQSTRTQFGALAQAEARE